MVLIVAPVLGWFAGPTWFVVGLFAPIGVTFAAWMPAMAARHLALNPAALVRESLPGPALVATIVVVCGLALQWIWPPEHVVTLVAECAAVLAVFAGLAALVGLDRQSRQFAVDLVRSRLIRG